MRNRTLTAIEFVFGLRALICLIAAHSDYEGSIAPMKKYELLEVEG
jgi:hypothetical protein